MYIIRCYFNNHWDYPLIWSMDRGTIETEKHYKEIKISGCKIDSHYNKDADNKKEPKAWLEIECNRLVEMNNILYID